MGFLDALRRKSSQKAVFLGLDSSGKSTIISFLQEGRFVQHAPTMGKQKLEMDVNGTRISMMDMGGQADFRNLWLGEMNKAKCVVFVIDKSNPSRFTEAKAEIAKILPVIKQGNMRLLILANKHDLPGAVSLPRIIKEFDLYSLENFEILEISAKTGYGVADAFAKFFSLLTGETINKNKLGSAMSVYSSSGSPIVKQIDRELASSSTSIEDSFLQAVKAANANNGSRDIVTYPREGQGTFLVGRSQHYIASLLWQNNLNVPIEQSKNALAEFLDHMERVVVPDNKDAVTLNAQHYMTNIL